jgi:hypothetical protein
VVRTQPHAPLTDPTNQCPPVKKNPLRPCTIPKNRNNNSTFVLASHARRIFSPHQHAACLVSTPCDDSVSSWTHSSFQPLLLQLLLRHGLLLPGRQVLLGILVQKEVADTKNHQGSHHHNENNEPWIEACALLNTSLLPPQRTQE